MIELHPHTLDPHTNGQPSLKVGFSVLMSVYKNEDPLRFQSALTSIFQNTLLPDQVILVIDGPVPDALEQIASTFSDSYKILKIVRIQKNVGLAKALNYGLLFVETEWVARADTDDFNCSNRFAMQMQYLMKVDNSIDLLGAQIEEVEVDGTRLGIRTVPLKHDEISSFMVYRNPFNHMTVFFRTALALKVGGYPDIPLKEDYCLWASMLQGGARCANLDTVLVLATAGRGMISRRGGLKYAMAEVSLQRHLFRCDIKSSLAAYRDGVLRGSIFLLPTSIRYFIYRFFLRTIMNKSLI